MNLWNYLSLEYEVTDDDIRSCPGDYIGCEVCKYSNRCSKLLLSMLEEHMNDYSVETEPGRFQTKEN